jgi:molybdate transport system ATP-binding protein
MPETGLAFAAEAAIGGFHLDAAFEVGRGETLVLVGPSGAGKSTCLTLVAGLRRPRAARVVCGGAVWCDTGAGIDRPPEQRRAGLVFQEYALFPHRSVLGNVAYGPRARGSSRGEAEARAARWLDRLGLGELADRPVTSLSGGQRQRTALARALASDPQVLLLDEPFASLDAATRANVRVELRAFLEEVGLPTVLVTHDPVDALALGDRIAVLESGRVVQSGTREDLLAHPRSPVVAELAGLNLYRAELTAGRGLKEARVGDVVFHVLADDRAGPSFLAFAPSEVALSAERGPGSPQNVFAGTVREVLPLPDRLRVSIDAGVAIVAELTREAGATLAVRPGRPVWASIKATAIRVYG